jgi:hypothetical protein
MSVDEQVRETLASIGNGVAVEVGRAGSDFTHVAYAVGVAVGLQRISDSGAVVGGVGATVAVGVEWWRSRDCDGVVVAVDRDACARPEISRRFGLSIVVVSPVSDDAIASECDRVALSPGDACAWSEINGRVACAVFVPSPASDATIASECNGVIVAARNACAWSEINGRVALAIGVHSPAPDAAIASDCNGVESAPRDA